MIPFYQTILVSIQSLAPTMQTGGFIVGNWVEIRSMKRFWSAMHLHPPACRSSVRWSNKDAVFKLLLLLPQSRRSGCHLEEVLTTEIFPAGKSAMDGLPICLKGLDSTFDQQKQHSETHAFFMSSCQKTLRHFPLVQRLCNIKAYSKWNLMSKFAVNLKG